MTEVQRVDAVERRLSDHRRLVLALPDGAPVELAGSAPIVWDLLAQTCDLAVVEEHLAAMFSDPPEMIAAGLAEAVRLLEDAELIERVP